jgi:hypothetical protein
MEETRNAINSRGLDLFVTRCKNMEYESNPVSSPIVCRCGVASVEEQIIDFLDGKTDGEDLLHALYDHIFDEPIPERMRSLFKR